MIFDDETGKPKGYGFCEFTDAESAVRATRELFGHLVNGRPLRVDLEG